MMQKECKAIRSSNKYEYILLLLNFHLNKVSKIEILKINIHNRNKTQKIKSNDVIKKWMSESKSVLFHKIQTLTEKRDFENNISTHTSI